VNFFETQK